jgi:hypothetical protein
VFHSLFETDERRGAVSSAVAEFWGVPVPRVAAEAEALPRNPAAGKGAPGGPFDLFQDLPPTARALFKGGA